MYTIVKLSPLQKRQISQVCAIILAQQISKNVKNVFMCINITFHNLVYMTEKTGVSNTIMT